MTGPHIYKSYSPYLGVSTGEFICHFEVDFHDRYSGVTYYVINQYVSVYNDGHVSSWHR